MNYLERRETLIHGTFDFPFAFYRVGEAHPRYNMVYHWHREYELIRVVRGELALTLNDTKFTARQGDVAFITDGALHGGVPKDCLYECAVFDMDALVRDAGICRPETLTILGHERQIRQYFPADEVPVHSHVNRLFDAFAACRPGYQFTVVGALYGFLGAVIEHKLYEPVPEVSPSGRKRLRQLKNVLNYIRRNYGENLSLSDLAAQAEMNCNYFCRFFREMTHKTPMEYLNYYRVECACERLITTEESVTDVALACGFNDSSYFIKVFKKRKGVTPSQYLQEALTTKAV